MSEAAVQELTESIRGGDRAALARGITLIESTAPEAQLSASQLMAGLSSSASGLRLGITGIPGVGKSTLIEALGMELINRGHRVAVLAIDPSSARSGGSILGDKTRMERLSVNASAFVRPTATGGNLGGVARRTRECIALCEAAGFDHVIVETVGVGQNELSVDRMCDLNILLMIAGAGDELQGIKRGIMESADVLVLNKYDGDGKQRAERARGDLQQAVQLLPPRASGRRPKALLCSATEGTGIAALADHLKQLSDQDRASGAFAERRKGQLAGWFNDAVLDLLVRTMANDPALAARRGDLEKQVGRGAKSPEDAAQELLAFFRTSGAPPRG